jgi:hypothetical protein
MRKLAVGVPATLAAFAVAVPALAASTWPAVSAKATVTPSTAGTAAHPQAVKLRVQLNWKTLGAANQPIVTNFKVFFPQGSLYNGGKTKTCAYSVLVSRGPTQCPSASIVGSGTGVAYAGSAKTHPQITVVNGGATKAYFYTVLTNPARVQEPIVAHIAKQHGKWAYELTATVPNNLRIVAGTPVELTSLTINTGKGNWLETTKCDAGHKWPYSVTTGFVNPNTKATGSSSVSTTTACH